MNVFKKINTFFTLDKKTKSMFIEAFFYLAWARILKAVPFSKVAPTLGAYMNETSLNDNESNRVIIKKDFRSHPYYESLHILGKPMSC